MENKEQIDQLILSFLSNETGEEQDKTLIDWINADQGNLQYFEELRKTWRLTSLKNTPGQVDVDAEWERFKRMVARKETLVIPMDETRETSADVFDLPSRKFPIRRMLLAVAVAASLLLVLALRFDWFNSPEPARNEIVKVEKDINDTRPASLHHEINTSGMEKRIVLEDGTEIVLADKSELSYPIPFPLRKRELSLTGEAKFKVAKDSDRPFTVFSGDLATTVVGTQFTVTNYLRDDQIRVRLYEGKVVVRSGAQTAAKKTYDLLPGNELIYYRKTSQAFLKKFNEKSPVNKAPKDAAVTRTNRDTPSLPKNKKGSWFMFNNQPLSEVLDRLGSMYSVEIAYNKKEIANIYFIGSFERSDSIEKILSRIAITNNLKITKAKEGNKYSIHK